MQELAIIEELIDQANKTETARKEKEAVELQELIKKVREDAIARIGEAWTWLQSCVTEKVYVKDDGRRVEIEWSFLPGKTFELKLAPIEIGASNLQSYRSTKIAVWNKNGYSSFGYDYQQLGEAIYKAREMFPAYNNEACKRFIESRAPQLNWFQNQDRTKAVQAHRELVEGIPDRKTEWDEKLNAWIKEYETKQQEDKKREELSARYDALKETYRLQYEAYLRSLDATDQHNREVLKAVQDLLDIPFDCWKLIYAIHAREEEYGESIVDQCSVWLAQPDQVPETGEYVLVGGRRVKFFNPVSLEKYTFKPTDEIGGSYKEVRVHGLKLFAPASMDQQELDASVASAGFMPLPEEPAVPSDLNSYDASRIRQSSRTPEELVW